MDILNNLQGNLQVEIILILFWAMTLKLLSFAYYKSKDNPLLRWKDLLWYKGQRYKIFGSFLICFHIFLLPPETFENLVDYHIGQYHVGHLLIAILGTFADDIFVALPIISKWILRFSVFEIIRN